MNATDQPTLVTGLLAMSSSKLADRNADLLAIGWRRRIDRLRNPTLDFADLVAYDERMQAALTALVHLGEPARQHLRGLLNEPMRSADLFALSSYALATQDRELLDASFSLSAAIPELTTALAAALEWAPVSPLLESSIAALPAVERIRLAGLRHRDIPGLDERTLVWLRTLEFDTQCLDAVMQMIRALGRADLAPVALPHLDHALPAVRTAAARTLLALAPSEYHGPACDALQTLATCEQDAAARSALRALALHAPTRAQAILAQLSQPEHHRRYLLTLGWLGRADAIPELIESLQDGSLSRVAAASLALITGSDPGRDGWLGAKPEKKRRPTETGDHLPEHPDDDELPWPDARAFSAWWRTRQTQFAADQRYFAGQPLTPAWLATVLQTGLLPWRPLAAEHRQRLAQGPLFPTHLPASAQRLRFSELN